jgi:hypothetical protein
VISVPGSNDDDGLFEPDDIAVPPANFRVAGKGIADGLADSSSLFDAIKGTGSVIWDGFLGLLAVLIGIFLRIVIFFANGLLRLREDNEPEIARLAAVSVADLLGVKVPEQAFIKAGERPGRSDVAAIVGGEILGAISEKLGDVSSGTLEPSDEPAKRYMGKMADLAVEGWFEKALCGMFPMHMLEDLGELKESVSDVFGFGRLTRTVLKPAIDIMVAHPHEMLLNKRYRPKSLTEAQLVRQYARGTLTLPQLREQLARLGYSDDNIDALINDSSKFVGVSDLAFLVRNGYWAREDAITHLMDQGYTKATASLLLEIERVRRIDAAKQEMVSAATDAFIAKEIDVDKFNATCKAAGIEDEVLTFVRSAAAIRQEMKRTLLSESQAEDAVKKGFWTFGQFVDYLKLKNYQDDDVTTRMLLLQDQIRADAESATKRKALEDQRTADRKARLAAAAARQAALDAKRSQSQLSIAQVEKLFIRSQLTEDQYRAFLVAQKYSASDIGMLLELANDDRQTYQDGLAKRAEADQKASVTSLSASQMEKAVLAGALTVAQYQQILTSQGIDPSDVAVLVQTLQVNLDAHNAALQRKAAAAAALAKKGLSLDQFDRAVRHGLRTMADYRQFLAGQGYGVEDVETLAGLLQDQIDADTAAQQKRDEIALQLQQKNISLADLAKAVKAGLRPITDYRAVLQKAGYSTIDQDTLVGLLQREIDDAAAAEKRKQELAAQLAEKGLSLPELERAVVLGFATMERYEEALTVRGITPADQAILVEMLQARVDDATQAKALKSKAEEASQNKPASLADIARGVKLGYRTMVEYRAAIAAAGFSSNAQSLMVSLLQSEIDQIAAAKARRAALDAAQSRRELSRSDLERAVKAGLKTLDEYQTFLGQQGYSESDQALLVELLASEVAVT